MNTDFVIQGEASYMYVCMHVCNVFIDLGISNKIMLSEKTPSEFPSAILNNRDRTIPISKQSHL